MSAARIMIHYSFSIVNIQSDKIILAGHGYRLLPMDSIKKASKIIEAFLIASPTKVALQMT